ncbi:uncharacterized protein LOC108149849 [Drosophila elegans]|uniref:uncharacterized protein LOC108149849 n=1 Tax=Drosophila elegans TaxID=30023 RepID=UPI0007E6CAB1|nr:uncharacterized protein LOC108149849 [Drosophila elegans]
MRPHRHQRHLLAAAATLCCLLAIIVQPVLSDDPPPPLAFGPTIPTQNSTEQAAESALSDSGPKELNKQAAGQLIREVIEGTSTSTSTSLGRELLEDTDPERELEASVTEKEDEFVGVPGFLPTVLPPRDSDTPANGHGYIQFDINDELPVEVARRQRPIEQIVTRSRTDTVNEVLSNLFPKGFSDIFRFSGNTEASTSTTTTTTTTTTDKAVARPTVVDVVSTTQAVTTEKATEAPAPATAPNATYYSYQTTVTKEYRRELGPGHTEIVVEQIRDPGFRDGSNHISRDELLRINRAAVAAPVLPSVLLQPEGDDNETLVAAESSPIVILGEHEVELEEGQEIDDNQIAETRHVGREAYQQRLPAPTFNGVESYANQKGPGQDQEINVHIVHDDTVEKSQKGQGKVLQEEVKLQAPQHSLDHFQVHSEQRFQQHHPSPEAPSRQFLKSFNPIVQGSGVGPLPKGSFHYEGQSPPQRPNLRQPKEEDYGKLVRPAAQLAYQQEFSQVTPQVQKQPEQQKPESLHTKAISSPLPAVPQYSGYAGPTPASATPNSLVFVTLNTPSPPHSSPAPQVAHSHTLEPGVQITVNHPSPHTYVAEAAAEQSQQHVVQAPVPKKSSPYTFVEVQKSVNIHNKLITEKDGRLVEQHETIYHQPYLLNHLPSPAPADPTKSYSSLAKNPIHVEYDSSPQEVAISHAAIHLDTGHSDHSAPGPVQQTVHPGPIYTPTEQEQQVHHQENHVQQVPQDHQVHQDHQVLHEPQLNHEPQIHLEHLEHLEHHDHHDHHDHHNHHDHHEHPAPQPYHDHDHDHNHHAQQVVEKHIPIPYAVPQPVPVPVHVEHYVDRPYPVETIVEHPVPYPVERVVEKIVEKHVPVEVERIVERPVHVEKIVEKFVDRPMAIPIHVPVAIHMPMPPGHSSLAFAHHGHPNALTPWAHSVAHIPPKVLQNYYTRMLKKLLPQLTAKAPAAPQSPKAVKLSKPVAAIKQPVKPVRGEAPKVATFSLADMKFDLRPPPPPQGSPWLQGARYIYNTLPVDLATAAASSAPVQMVKSYIGPVPATTSSVSGPGDAPLTSEFDEFQRWRNGHSLKRSPDFGRNLQLEYGFKPPLVPSMEIDDKGNPLKQAEQSETQ